jgi:hypothetical protein
MQQPPPRACPARSCPEIRRGRRSDWNAPVWRGRACHETTRRITAGWSAQVFAPTLLRRGYTAHSWPPELQLACAQSDARFCARCAPARTAHDLTEIHLSEAHQKHTLASLWHTAHEKRLRTAPTREPPAHQRVPAAAAAGGRAALNPRREPAESAPVPQPGGVLGAGWGVGGRRGLERRWVGRGAQPFACRACIGRAERLPLMRGTFLAAAAGAGMQPGLKCTAGRLSNQNRAFAARCMAGEKGWAHRSGRRAWWGRRLIELCPPGARRHPERKEEGEPPADVSRAFPSFARRSVLTEMYLYVTPVSRAFPSFARRSVLTEMYLYVTPVLITTRN